MRLGRRATLLAALLLPFAARASSAQGSCTVNNRATCELGGTAAYGMNITIPRVVRLSVPSNPIALGVASPTDFTAGFGTPVLASLNVRANSGWNITLAATAGTFTGTGPLARPNKPVSDLQWALAAGGPFTPVSTTATTIATGTATAGQAVTLHLRAAYAWTLDTPGAYSLPLQLTITAP